MPVIRYSPQDLSERAKRLGVTHAQMAEQIGVSRQTVTDTLAGRSRHPATRAMIAQIVRVDPSDVDWGDE